VRSNEYTSASYTLSPDAHRLLSVAISEIKQTDISFVTCRMYAKNLIEYFPAWQSDKNAIARIDKATDVLMSSFIKVKQSDGREKKNLINSCRFSSNSGNPFIDIKFDDDMLPYFIGLN